MESGKLSAIGLIGLGVMGENLALNIERHGYQISIYNRSHDKVVEFVEGRGRGKKVVGCPDEKSFVKVSLARARLFFWSKPEIRLILLLPN
jgi:6-phosphogluconate dehydrogenase